MILTELEKKFNSAKENAGEVVEAVIPLVNAYQQVRKFDSAIRCLQETLVRDEIGVEQEAVILTALGTAFWEKAQLQKALNHFKQALALFEQTNDKTGQAVILSIVGITFWRKCEWDKALKILKDVLSRKNKEQKVEPRFASLYGALERGIITLQNRVRMGRELKAPVKILQPLFSLCALYWVTGNSEQLKVCLDEAVSLAEQLGKADILSAANDLKMMR